MRYACLGDIHSNLEALQAVLAAVEEEGADVVLCHGDVVGYGADPAACIDLIRTRARAAVAGNHDHAVVEKMSREYFNPYARDAIDWTRAQLHTADLDWLASLPLTHRVDDQVTLVHAALKYPDMFEYVQTCFEAKECMNVLDTKVAFFGHSHVPVAFFDGPSTAYSLSTTLNVAGFDKCLVNAGSVGQPRDEVPDACYALYDSDRQLIEIKRVPYDIETAAQKILDAGLPKILAERLFYGK